MDREAWKATVHGVAESQTGLSDLTFTFFYFPGGSDGKASAYNSGDLGSILGREDLLEKKMATHSSTVAWKIPWTKEPGRL